MKEKHKDPAFKKSHSDGIKDSWDQDRKARQSIISKSMWQSDKFRETITQSSQEAWDDIDKRSLASTRATALWHDERYLAKQEEANITRSSISTAKANELWADPQYKEKQLSIKQSQGHVALQSFLASERWKDPKYRLSVIDSLIAYNSNPDIIRELSDNAVKLWSDPDYMQKQTIANTNSDLLALKSENAKLQWKDPVIRQKIVDGIKRVWESPEYRAAAAEISKRRWQDAEFRRKQAVARSNILTNGKDSILERVAQNILGSLDIPYIRHHVIGYFEFDLFIPSHKLLIECNGEYWHSLRKSKDAAKFTYIDTYFPDHKVLYLWEREFLNPGLIHQKLVQALLLDETECQQIDFEFSNVSIKKMSVKDILPGSYYSAAEEFLQSFHYAGYGRSAKTIFGAYFDGKLIGVIKFSPPGRSESATSMGFAQKQVMELDRFCIHPLYQKRNFASWLLSRTTKSIFAELSDIQCIISFADFTLGHVGTIYRAANWQELHQTKPDYHYLNADGFVVHKKTLYDHASRNSQIEGDYALEYGYTKVFGKPKTKFCLYRSKD